MKNELAMIAERLKNIRIEKRLSQRMVAEELGISKPIISQYESGQRLPSVPKLIQLSKYYKVSLDYLCGRTETKQINDMKTTLVLCKGTNLSLMTIDDAMQEIYNTILAHREDTEGFDEYLEDNPHASFKDFAKYRTDCYEEEILNGFGIELYGIVYQTIEFKEKEPA